MKQLSVEDGFDIDNTYVDNTDGKVEYGQPQLGYTPDSRKHNLYLSIDNRDDGETFRWLKEIIEKDDMPSVGEKAYLFSLLSACKRRLSKQTVGGVADEPA